MELVEGSGGAGRGSNARFEGGGEALLRAAAGVGAIGILPAIAFHDTQTAGAISFFAAFVMVVRAVGSLVAYPDASAWRFAPSLVGGIVSMFFVMVAVTGSTSGKLDVGRLAPVLVMVAACVATCCVIVARRRRNAARAIAACPVTRGWSAEQLGLRERRVPSNYRFGAPQRMVDVARLPRLAWRGVFAGREAVVRIGRAKVRARASSRGVRRFIGRLVMGFTMLRLGAKNGVPEEYGDVLLGWVELPITPADGLPVLRVRPRDRGLGAFAVTAYSDAEQQLESIDLDHRYEIRADAHEDALRVRQVLDPVLLVALLDVPSVYVDVTETSLSVYRHGQIDERELEAMFRVAHVLLERGARLAAATPAPAAAVGP